MPPILSLVLFGIEELVKVEPEIAASIGYLIAKGNPTAQDWADLRAQIFADSYQKYDPGFVPRIVQAAPAAQSVPPILDAPAAQTAPTVTPASKPAPAVSAGTAAPIPSLMVGDHVAPDAAAQSSATILDGKGLPNGGDAAAPLDAAPAPTKAQLLAATRGGGNPYMQPNAS